MRIKPFRHLGVILVAVVLSGCWLQLGAGPGNTRFNGHESQLTLDNVATLAEQWRTPVDSIITEPLVSGDRIYVANRRHVDLEYLDVLSMQAYDSDTGELVWERSLLPTDGSRVDGLIETPALAGGALWVTYWHEGLGPCEGRLARLDPDTGEILSSEVTARYTSPVVVAGSVVAYTEACEGSVQLVVRDLETREIQWTHTFPPRSGVLTPTIAGGRLFLVAGQSLHAFAAEGCGASSCAPLWTEPMGDGVFSFLRPVAGSRNSIATFASSSAAESISTLVVQDTATGKRRWEAETRYTGNIPGAITGMAVAYDTIYVTGTTLDDPSSEPEAVLDAYPIAGCGEAVCSPAWSVSLGATRPAHEPTVAGGVVYVPIAANNPVAPAMAAVDAHGCGASTCEELVRVPLVGGAGSFSHAAEPYRSSVAEGRLIVGWFPDRFGSTLSQLSSLGPSDG